MMFIFFSSSLMRESAFSTVQDVLRHCIHFLPIALYVGRVRLEDGKQTSVLSSLLGVTAAIEIFFYYYCSNSKIVSDVRNLEHIISSWSLSPVMLNLVLGGDPTQSWTVLACGLLPLTLPYDTLLRFINKSDHFLLLLTFSIHLIFVVSYSFSISAVFIAALVISSYVTCFAFPYTTLHEKILLYSTHAFLLCELFLNHKITQRITLEYVFSAHSYLVVFEVALFSLSVMLFTTVCISAVVEYLFTIRHPVHKIINRAVVTVDIIAFVSLGFVIPRLTHILGVNPFLWLGQVFALDNFLAVPVAVVWVIIIVIFVFIADWMMTNWQLSKNHGRKIFHVMVVVMFVPVMWHPTLLRFTSLSFGGACCIFVLIEFIRVYIFQGRLRAINQYFEMFISGNELQQKKRVILSHTSLLVGCATTIWIWSVNTHYDKSLAYMGMISLGVGDAMAAVIGSLYGQRRWKESRKTYLGSIAALISMIVFSLVIIAIDANVPFSSLNKIITTSIALILAEVMLEGNDNFSLPLFGAIVYMLL